jgi:hypothetical protein
VIGLKLVAPVADATNKGGTFVAADLDGRFVVIRHGCRAAAAAVQTGLQVMRLLFVRMLYQRRAAVLTGGWSPRAAVVIVMIVVMVVMMIMVMIHLAAVAPMILLGSLFYHGVDGRFAGRHDCSRERETGVCVCCVCVVLVRVRIVGEDGQHSNSQ